MLGRMRSKSGSAAVGNRTNSAFLAFRAWSRDWTPHERVVDFRLEPRSLRDQPPKGSDPRRSGKGGTAPFTPMRRFALFFAGFVVLTVAALNYIDAKYPGGIRNFDFSSAPVEPQVSASTEPGLKAPTPAPAPAATAVADYSAPEIHPMWPGSKIEKIAYGARRYEDMTVVSISAQSVVLRNDREIVSIPTGSLPADLRQMAVAYLSGSDGPPFARMGSPAFPPPPETATPAPAAANPAVVQPQEQELDAAQAGHRAIALKAARERAEWWLRFERERRLADIVPLVTGVDMQSPYPVMGLHGYWRVRGRGYVATYQEDKGGTFHDFEITVVLDDAGNVLRADIKIL